MAHRRPLIAGNWKMHKTCTEATDSARSLVALTAGVANTDIMIAPSFTALSHVCNTVSGSAIAVGAQNLYWEDQGAFTGEISAAMIRSTGCRYVIIGHSERRQLFGETDETVHRKIAAALENELIPVFCIGESEKEREDDLTFSVLDKQVNDGLKEMVSDDLTRLVIAYEPVWAIGTGKTATAQQAQEVHAFVRSLVEKSFGRKLAEGMRILYGGSVKPANIVELMSMADVDGALVGGASLDAETFSRIVRFE